jgi:hypothetical protein
MVTLTDPPSINMVLGGNVPAEYTKLVIGPFTMDPIAQLITGTLRLTSTQNPLFPILGTLNISAASSTVRIEVKDLNIARQIQTTGPQNTSIIAWIETAQKQIEDGLVAVNLIAGVRTAGV